MDSNGLVLNMLAAIIPNGKLCDSRHADLGIRISVPEEQPDWTSGCLEGEFGVPLPGASIAHVRPGQPSAYSKSCQSGRKSSPNLSETSAAASRNT